MLDTGYSMIVIQKESSCSSRGSGTRVNPFERGGTDLFFIFSISGSRVVAGNRIFLYRHPVGIFLLVGRKWNADEADNADFRGFFI
jgi:hypothetical protein